MYKSKTFKNDNFFVLYDINDNIIAYFDSFVELSKIFNYRLCDLVFQATLETRTSKKGSKYEVIVIKLSDNAEKLVFLNSAELELLKLYNGI